jgi:RNA polymerase sigma-70 factor (ECF subfamily)
MENSYLSVIIEKASFMWKFFRQRKSAAHLSDEALAATYRDIGGNELIGLLYDRYAQYLFGFCMKYMGDEEMAKDIVADIFLKLFEDLKRFEVRQFKSWITRVAYNACMTKLTIMNKRIPIGEEHLAWEEDESVVKLSEISPGELATALAELKPEQKVCIQMFYLEKKSYQLISEQIGYDIKKVKSYIQNGKRNLELYFRCNHEKEQRKATGYGKS